MFDGSGGNHYYDFNNGVYKYRCYVIVLGKKDSPPGQLEVYKNEVLLLEAPVVKTLER